MAVSRPACLLIVLCLAAGLGAGAAASRASAATPTTLQVTPTTAGLGDKITLTVSNLKTLLNTAGGCQSVVLFLRGLALTGTTPSACDPDTGNVNFVLSRTDTDKDNWDLILGKPTSRIRPVLVTVGSSTTRSYPTKVTLRLVELPTRRLWEFAIFGPLLIWLMIRLGRRTGMLREAGGDPTRAPNKRPYSLARTQQAFWFTLAALAYVFVWLMTSELNSLSNSTVVLIGISGATTLGAATIASNGRQQLGPKRAKLEDDLAKAAAPAGATPEEVQAADAKVKMIQWQLDKVEASIRKSDSNGFWHDLVADETGAVSVQRLQIVIWTLILGSIFVRTVYEQLTMPEFSGTLLALMGISGGTYLVGKSGEVTAAANPEPPPTLPS